MNYRQLIYSPKWKFDYIIARKKKEMNEKIVHNRFVPKFVPRN